MVLKEKLDWMALKKCFTLKKPQPVFTNWGLFLFLHERKFSYIFNVIDCFESRKSMLKGCLICCITKHVKYVLLEFYFQM